MKLYLILIVTITFVSGMQCDIIGQVFHTLKEKFNSKLNEFKESIRKKIDYGRSILFEPKSGYKKLSLADEATLKLHNINEDFKKTLHNPLRVFDKNKDWNSVILKAFGINNKGEKGNKLPTYSYAPWTWKNHTMLGNHTSNKNDSFENDGFENDGFENDGFEEYQEHEHGIIGNPKNITDNDSFENDGFENDGFEEYQEHDHGIIGNPKNITDNNGVMDDAGVMSDASDMDDVGGMEINNLMDNNGVTHGKIGRRFKRGRSLYLSFK